MTLLIHWRNWLRARCVALGMGLLLCALMGALPHTAFMERLERRAQDMRFELRGPRATQASIVIVGISDRALARWPEPMVFWSAHYARIITQAHRAGANCIGLDIIPAVDADNYLDNIGADAQPRPDAALEAAIEAASGRVLLSYIQNASPAPAAPLTRFLSLPQAAGHLGFVDLPPETNDVARRALRRLSETPTAKPSLPALLADRLRGLPSGSTARAGHSLFWVNYAGRDWPQIEADRMEAGLLTGDERRELRGAVVLVGMTYSYSTDKYRIPGRQGYVPGVSVVADAAATLADGRELRRATPAREGVEAAFLAAVMLFGARCVPFWRGLLLSVLAGGFWCALAQWAFVQRDYLLPVAAPLAACGLSWPLHHTLRSLTESAQRRRIEGIFGRYLSPQVRDHLMQDEGRLRLGGETLAATVLFLDIRGFTTYAEKRPADAVMTELNAFFAGIVPAIDAYEGLLHKFTGDGLLALFGVPAAQSGHAQAAVNAALAITEAVRASNGERVRQGKEPWRIGCGIHTGPVVCGNVGIAVRAEYTVIGDTVNLAARLEGLNKQLESEIVFSQATWEQLDARPPVEGPVEMDISGRQGRVNVYWMQSRESQDARETKAAAQHGKSRGPQ